MKIFLISFTLILNITIIFVNTLFIYFVLILTKVKPLGFIIAINIMNTKALTFSLLLIFVLVNVFINVFNIFFINGKYNRAYYNYAVNIILI
jgi:hypothetical protein